jgi:hypothetical protein
MDFSKDRLAPSQRVFDDSHSPTVDTSRSAINIFADIDTQAFASSDVGLANDSGMFASWRC